MEMVIAQLRHFKLDRVQELCAVCYVLLSNDRTALTKKCTCQVQD